MTSMARPQWAWQPHPIRRQRDDSFFEHGDMLCGQRHKQVITVEPTEEEQDKLHEKISLVEPFKCQSGACKKMFSTISQYEIHYNSAHRHPCLDCQRSFPTNHLLDIHITEWHDPLFDIQSQKQNMYRCLLDTCSEKLSNHHTRRDHMIKIHKYPSNFRFEKPHKDKVQPVIRQKQTGPKKSAPPQEDSMETDSVHPSPKAKAPPNLAFLARKSLSSKPSKQLKQKQAGQSSSVETMQEDNVVIDSNLEMRGSSGVCSSSHDQDQQGFVPDMEVDTADGSQGVSPSSGRSRFTYRASIPKTICFGAGTQRGFHRVPRGRGRGKHWHQTQAPSGKDTSVNLEQVDMMDLSTALDET